MAYYISSENVDYNGMRTLVTLPLTESIVCFNVTILSDNREELVKESFRIVVIPGAGIMTDRRERINIFIMDMIIGKQLDYSNLY